VADHLDVDGLTTELYTAPPEDFVKVRAEGVKRLKAADQGEAAADFAKLTKPSLSAWAVNLLVARRGAAVDDVIERGDALRRAHTGGGGADEIRAAQRARHDALRAATAAAAELTGRPLSDAHRAEISATLEAASADAEIAAEVRRGRLARPLEPPTGFDLFAPGLSVVSGGRAARPARRAATEEPDDEAEERAQAARAEMLAAEADSALAAATEADEAAADLRQRVEELEQQRDEAEAELRRLDGELTAARRDARDAERVASDATRKATRAASRADRATP
jgi:hypothetical protein